MQITPISTSTTGSVSGLQSSGKTANDAVNQIGKSFNQIIDSLNQSQENADSLVQQLSAGEDVDLHDVTIGLEENDVNFRVAMAIRDKLVEAYQEVMRMQV